jgi:hypothetical protein
VTETQGSVIITSMVSLDLLQHAIEKLTRLHASEPSLDRTSAVLRLRKALPTLDREALSVAVDSYFSRDHAINKLGAWAEHGLFLNELLEQASRYSISKYRADFFQGLSNVLEIGTGTGADTAAIARVAKHVTSIESDPLRAALARENLRIQGISNITILDGELSKVISTLDLSTFDGLFADPARRTRSGVRVRDASDYSPPLDALLSLPVGKIRAIKVSPGLFFQPPTSEWRRHFIGVGSECLEQTLIFGIPMTDSGVQLADYNIGWQPKELLTPPTQAPEIFQGYISEAHALINRSQHLLEFFTELEICQIAQDVAYGVSIRKPPPSPLLASFRIVESGPFSASKLKSILHALRWSNRTEFKKRNCSIDLEALQISLKLPAHTHNSPFGTVFVFKCHGENTMILGERLSE